MSNLPCPKCGGDARVSDSRPHELGVHRRRKCMKCGERFSTMEMIRYKQAIKLQNKLNELVEQLMELKEGIDNEHD